MGHNGSKSSIEARVIFQRVGPGDMCPKMDAGCTPGSIVHIQRKVTTEMSGLHSSTRGLDKSPPHSWAKTRCDARALVYVMDNPTGGVWVKPGDKWGRS